MSVRLFSKVIVFTELEILFSLGNLIIVKTYVHFAVIVSQSAGGISAVFRNFSYIKSGNYLRSFSLNIGWHIATLR